MTVPHDARRERLARMRDEMVAHGLDAALIAHRPNVRYLSGFSGSSGWLIVLPEEAGLITDFRYEQQAGDEVAGVAEVIIVRNGLLSGLAQRLEDRAQVRRVGFEPSHLTVRDRRELGERCGGVVWEEMPGIVEQARAVKEPDELAQIEAAVRIAETALEEVLGVVEEGLSERQLAAELDYRLALHGSSGPAFETIVASGARTALPHARPSERTMAEGDLVLLDFGATLEGYCSDITRTVVLGAAKPWQRAIHEGVLEAQAAALEAIRPEGSAADVDRAARERLASTGLAEQFGHSIGHGIGLEVHEGPRLHKESKEKLSAGNVVTVEPGVYLAGKGGVRVEEDVVVVEAGHRVLTASSRALREL